MREDHARRDAGLELRVHGKKEGASFQVIVLVSLAAIEQRRQVLSECTHLWQSCFASLLIATYACFVGLGYALVPLLSHHDADFIS